MNTVITVIVPVYNGEKNLEVLYLTLAAALDVMGDPWEIIMVDDGSRDAGWECMKTIREGDSRVKIIKLDRNYGQQKALMCGLKQAAGEYILTLDDDLQHPPEEISCLIKKLKEGHDLVFGVFSRKMHSRFRNMGSCVTNQVFNLAGLKSPGLRISSYRALKRELAEKTAADAVSFVYLSAHLLKHARNPVNVDVRHGCGTRSSSRYSNLKLLGLLVNLVFYYYLFPQRNKYGGRPLYIIEDKYL